MLGRANYKRPKYFLDIKRRWPVIREEVFGPVRPLLRFKTEEETISIANDTDAAYACLAAYLLGVSVQRTWRVAEALEYVIVGINGLVSSEVEEEMLMCKLHFGKFSICSQAGSTLLDEKRKDVFADCS
ncbi:hypothetical protein AgCh_021313 [Apium graveolens]